MRCLHANAVADTSTGLALDFPPPTLPCLTALLATTISSLWLTSDKRHPILPPTSLVHSHLSHLKHTTNSSHFGVPLLLEAIATISEEEVEDERGDGQADLQDGALREVPRPTARHEGARRRQAVGTSANEEQQRGGEARLLREPVDEKQKGGSCVGSWHRFMY